jgi:hypothetical protein
MTTLEIKKVIGETKIPQQQVPMVQCNTGPHCPNSGFGKAA